MSRRMLDELESKLKITMVRIDNTLSYIELDREKQFQLDRDLSSLIDIAEMMKRILK